MSKKVLQHLSDVILCGDSAFLLPQIPSNSIDLVVTSPPYFKQRNYNSAGLGIGNENSVENYLDSLIEVFKEVVRVVKPSGSIVYNVGDKYIKSSLSLVPYRFAIKATQNCDVRLVNNITWVKSNPTPRQFDRRLVNSTEPFFHFTKGATYYYDRESFMESDTHISPYKPTTKLGAKYRTLIDQSDLLSKDKHKAHQELDQVISEVHNGKIQGFRMKIKGIHAEAFGGQEGGRKRQMESKGFTVIRIHGRAMKKDVISSAVESIPGIKHGAVYPLSIISEIIKLLCPRNGIVLDPYLGSGTTAVAAIKDSRHFIGIDVDPTYCELAKQRIEKCQKN